MRPRLHLAVIPAALLLAPAVVHAEPPSFITNGSLSFGRFAAGTGGTVSVSAAGARSSTGGVALLTSNASAAAFTFTDAANPDRSCIITLPADGGVILSSGTSQIILKQFTSNPSGSAIMQGGNLQLSVGATLSVGPNQSPGNYSGAMPITLEYQ